MSPRDRRRTCELGPIRPPSEATSLLLRVTRNCPWNRCAFCAVYKRADFGRRTEEEVIADIDLLADAAERIAGRVDAAGGSGRVTADAFLDIVHDPASTYEDQRVALWMAQGGRHVFLQDADSLVLPAARVARILLHLKERFPAVDRVTTYARSRTLVARSAEQLAMLRAAGLTRIHVGVESGAAEVLELMVKGCRPEHHVDGCRRAMAAGFEVCCYVMPGLGGRRLTEAHAVETAAVLKAVDPHHVRLRTLWIDPGSPLEDMLARGAFELLEEDEVVREIQRLLAGLVGARSRVISDHDRNLLQELEGHVTDDAAALQGLCAAFLELPLVTRDAFAVARRAGYFSSLAVFLADPEASKAFAPAAEELRRAGGGSLAAGIRARFDRRSI